MGLFLFHHLHYICRIVEVSETSCGSFFFLVAGASSILLLFVCLVGCFIIGENGELEWECLLQSSNFKCGMLFLSPNYLYFISRILIVEIDTLSLIWPLAWFGMAVSFFPFRFCLTFSSPFSCKCFYCSPLFFPMKEQTLIFCFSRNLSLSV